MVKEWQLDKMEFFFLQRFDLVVFCDQDSCNTNNISDIMIIITQNIEGDNVIRIEHYANGS